MTENSTQASRRKWIEPVVAIVMAPTTCCTAWCSYQSAAWTRQSNRLMNEYNALERRAAAGFAVAVFIFAVIRNAPHASGLTIYLST